MELTYMEVTEYGWYFEFALGTLVQGIDVMDWEVLEGCFFDYMIQEVEDNLIEAQDD
jgi:hypothetical protein